MPQTVERVFVQFAPSSASESQFRLAEQLEVKGESSLKDNKLVSIPKVGLWR